MTLIVVRHGSAEGNREHRFIGWSDVGLNAVGWEQAHALAERLADVGVTRVVSSDLRRAVETATPLAERLALEIEPDPRLREVNNGEWTGLLPEEIAERWPSLWEAYVAGEDVPRPGGERWAQVRERVRAALADRLGEETVVAVTHGGPVILAAEWALGLTLPGNIFKGPLAAPANGSLTVVVSGPRLLSYADTGHVTSLALLDVPYAPVT